MFSNKKRNNLTGFSVHTQGGYRLGVVSRVLKDQSSENISKIYVRKFILGIGIGKVLIIDRSQIIEIKKEDKKIVVDDLFLKERFKKTNLMPENV